MTDEAGASTPSPAIQLLEPCVLKAQRELDSNGELEPFAAYLNPEGRVMVLSAKQFRPGSDPVEVFTQRLRALVADQQASVTAICYMGWPVSKGDAIIVELETPGSAPMHAYVTYEPAPDGRFAYDEVEFGLGEARIFTK